MKRFEDVWRGQSLDRLMSLRFEVWVFWDDTQHGKVSVVNASGRMSATDTHEALILHSFCLVNQLQISQSITQWGIQKREMIGFACVGVGVRRRWAGSEFTNTISHTLFHSVIQRFSSSSRFRNARVMLALRGKGEVMWWKGKGKGSCTVITGRSICRYWKL